MALLTKWEVTTCQYITGQIALNRTYWLVGAETGAGASNAQIASGMNATFAPLYKAIMPASASWRGVAVRPVTTPVSATTVNVSSAGAGTASGNLLPHQTSFILALKTLFAGRGYRGRIFPGFPAVSFATSAGDLDVSAMAPINALATAYQTPVVCGFGGDSSTLQLCVRHNNRPPETPVPGFTYYLTSAVTARPAFATQRRRGQFGRLNTVPF